LNNYNGNSEERGFLFSGGIGTIVTEFRMKIKNIRNGGLRFIAKQPKRDRDEVRITLGKPSATDGIAIPDTSN